MGPQFGIMRVFFFLFCSHATLEILSQVQSASKWVPYQVKEKQAIGLCIAPLVTYDLLLNCFFNLVEVVGRLLLRNSEVQLRFTPVINGNFLRHQYLQYRTLDLKIRIKFISYQYIDQVFACYNKITESSVTTESARSVTNKIVKNDYHCRENNQSLKMWNFQISLEWNNFHFIY